MLLKSHSCSAPLVRYLRDQDNGLLLFTMTLPVTVTNADDSGFTIVVNRGFPTIPIIILIIITMIVLELLLIFEFETVGRC